MLQRKLLRMRLLISFGMFICVPCLALAQSSSSEPAVPFKIQSRSTIQKLYGNPVSEVYRTPQHLTVTASFASGGNLCRAYIQYEGGGEITEGELAAILKELAPDNVRGKHTLSTFLDVTCIKLQKPANLTSSGKPEVIVDPCAECSGVSDDYERTNITKYGNTNEYSSVRVNFIRPECKGLD
jgi:hypothetical protein